MSSRNLARWMSTIANVAVLAGLVLVAIEINQNSALARTALINDGNVVSNQIWADLIGENPGQAIALAVECPAQMTYADFMAVDAFLFSNLNMLYRGFQLAQEGIYTSSEWKSSVDAYAHWYLGNAFGRAWWDEEAKHFFKTEFTEYVDERPRHEGSDSHAHWENIRARVVTEDSGRLTNPCS